jgi:hypothetical protein
MSMLMVHLPGSISFNLLQIEIFIYLTPCFSPSPLAERGREKKGDIERGTRNDFYTSGGNPYLL